MKLHVIYRSYGGENRKSRPAYFSKLLALASFVRAVDQLESPVGLTFLNDGPVANDAYRLMQAVGRVVAFDRLGCRGSYAKALTLAAGCTGDESDIMWLAEDDYLYRPDALERLLSAARLIPWASYFALYGSFPTPEAEMSGEEDDIAPRGWRDQGGVTVHGHCWRHAVSTTSTFGARLPALRRDRQLFRTALYSARAWDHQTCLAYQGYVPFRGRWLLQDPSTRGTESVKSRIKVLGATPIKVVVDAMAYRRARQPGLLVAPRPALATHLELPYIAPGTDWDAEAEATTEWARSRGIPVPQSA
ncbi:MAG: hypothetical protein M3046_04885 [Actinomycetota bacterium]|nr:hypothetical protein [Actinomycetota bacterium]